MILKLSEFLNTEIKPFILGSFFSRIIFSKDNKYIYTNISYKKSSKIKNIDEYIFEEKKQKYYKKINLISGNCKWIKKENIVQYGIKIRNDSNFYFILQNDLNYSLDQFYSFINKTIYSQEWLYEDSLCEDKIQFLSGFMENRGSIDINRGFITIDYFYKNKFQLKRINIFHTYFQIPTNMLNINIRELQKEFIEGKERNTQFRIRLNWYMNYIGLYNDYKSIIVKENFSYKKDDNVNGRLYLYNDINIKIKNSIIDTRLDYYVNNILFDNEFDINKSRKELGFILENDCNEVFRNIEIVRYMLENQPDECCGCKNRYNIENRSFKKRNGKYYLEVHHMISLANDKYQLDVLENLVKLCPACHRQLKKNSAIEEDQKYLIKEILTNNINVREFCENFLFKYEDDLVEQIYQMLK